MAGDVTPCADADVLTILFVLSLYHGPTVSLAGFGGPELWILTENAVDVNFGLVLAVGMVPCYLLHCLYLSIWSKAPRSPWGLVISPTRARHCQQSAFPDQCGETERGVP